ncbi:DNA-binding protein [Lysobacter sp. SG-8]|uniref:DNA-binding protein n=1 Tax=Marilutibacter penaei TaxID=2759900 RepID=A0A7W3U5L7_9GAMM|nr:DNA-binding protein [Lysobacter penaei]MBB1089308.1 DNA-binding protein [Lysobacter penaei]
MARGITESDVHTAADAIVAAGERPTVERIRAHLGTGSPNTVTRWLESWWQGLGRRLNMHQTQLAVPDAPEAVARAAGQWWAIALEAAKSSLEAGLSVERAALQADRDALLKAREALDAEAVRVRSDCETALAARRLAEAQSTELARLVTRLEAQVKELLGQRDAAGTREAEVEASRQALEHRFQSFQVSVDSERQELLQHIRAVEERANAEIDRTRLEMKDLKAQLKDLRQIHAAAEKAARKLLDQAKAESKEVQRELELQRSRAVTAESRLGQLQEVSDAVEAAIRRAETSRGQSRGRGEGGLTPKKRSKIASGK